MKTLRLFACLALVLIAGASFASAEMLQGSAASSDTGNSWVSASLSGGTQWSTGKLTTLNLGVRPAVEPGANDTLVLNDYGTGNLKISTANFGSLLGPDSPDKVPEPSSLLLMGSGILGFAGMLRRKLIR